MFDNDNYDPSDDVQVAPLPQETPAEIDKRNKWTNRNIVITILCAALMIYWNWVQPYNSEHSAIGFTVLLSLLLIFTSFLSKIRFFYENGLARLARWIGTALLGVPTFLDWLLHGHPFLGQAGQWAYLLYIVLTTYFFVRVFGRFVSLLDTIFQQ